MNQEEVYRLPMPAGLEYLGREVQITDWSGSAIGHTYRFLDNNARCPIQDKARPKKGQLFLRPTGTYNRWKVEKADHNFQKQRYLIVGSGQV